MRLAATMANVVYFIGAGLSKSLEKPGRPIPLMFDFVSVMADYLHDDVILATLVSLERAGLYDWRSEDALRIADSNPREVREWTPSMRSGFRRALKNRPWESIETLLERCFERTSTQTANLYAQGIPQRFRYAINRLFYLIGWEVSWRTLDKFLMEQFRAPTRHTFVSFNYDLLLDRAIQKSASDWTFQAGYGFNIQCSYDGTGAKELVPSAAPSRVRILKPHGSLNWLVSEKMPVEHGAGGTKFKNGRVTAFVAPSGEVSYFGSTDTFHYLGEDAVELYIVPPNSAAKSQAPAFIQETRRLEEEAIREAEEAYVLGWSLPNTDQDQELLIRCSVRHRQHPFRSATVVNRGETPAYFKRVADVFGVSETSLRIHNGGFEEFVGVR
jgi:hypothetical protein